MECDFFIDSFFFDKYCVLKDGDCDCDGKHLDCPARYSLLWQLRWRWRVFRMMHPRPPRDWAKEEP